MTDYQKVNDSHSSNESHHGGFDDPELRLGFIRKTYGILTMQLGVTVAMCMVPFFNDDAKIFIRENFGIVITAAILGFILSCALFCVRSLARSVPTNYILCAAFTLCEGYLVMFACAAVGDPVIVL